MENSIQLYVELNGQKYQVKNAALNFEVYAGKDGKCTASLTVTAYGSAVTVDLERLPPVSKN